MISAYRRLNLMLCMVILSAGFLLGGCARLVGDHYLVRLEKGTASTREVPEANSPIQQGSVAAGQTAPESQGVVGTTPGQKAQTQGGDAETAEKENGKSGPANDAGAGDALKGPWSGAPQTAKEIGVGESITLHFDNGFLTDLPDWMQSNEVAVIFEFTEKGQTITKILGPIERTADFSYLNEIAKVVYGPKVVEDEFIHIKIRVVEIDAEENKDAKAFIDFVKTVAKPFAIADPVTDAEIDLTAKIARTLIDMNKNDEVVGFSFTLHAPRKENPLWLSIPLQEGIYALVQRTIAQDITHEYFYFTRKGARERGTWGAFNPVAWVADIVLLPVVAAGVLTDTPAAESKSHMTFGPDNELLSNMENDARRLFVDLHSRRLIMQKSGEKIKPYQEKNWLLFSIEKGNDTSAWKYRKILKPAEQTLLDAIHGKTTAETIRDALPDLEKSVDGLVHAKQSRMAHIYPESYEQKAGNAYPFSIYIPKDRTLQTLTLLSDSPQAITVQSTPSSSPDLAQYRFTTTLATTGTYRFQGVDDQGGRYPFNVEIKAAAAAGAQ